MKSFLPLTKKRFLLPIQKFLYDKLDPFPLLDIVSQDSPYLKLMVQGEIRFLWRLPEKGLSDFLLQNPHDCVLNPFHLKTEGISSLINR